MEKVKQIMSSCNMSPSVQGTTARSCKWKCRDHTLKADWIIYVVATEQSDHFKMLFKAGEAAGIYQKKR
jgi:hypothetical protein